MVGRSECVIGGSTYFRAFSKNPNQAMVNLGTLGGNIGRAVVSLVLDTSGYNAELQKAKGETVAATNVRYTSLACRYVASVAPRGPGPTFTDTGRIGTPSNAG